MPPSARLKARQADYLKRSEGAAAVLDASRAEKDLLESLTAMKIVALIEGTRASKVCADARTRHDEIITRTELERAQDHSDTLKERATLRQTLAASMDQLNRTTLVSPMRGIVNELNVTTIGGVVRPWQRRDFEYFLKDEAGVWPFLRRRFVICTGAEIRFAKILPRSRSRNAMQQLRVMRVSPRPGGSGSM